MHSSLRLGYVQCSQCAEIAQTANLGNYILDRPSEYPHNRFMDGIRTLQQAVQYFSNYENCKRVMVQLRWPDGVVKCPQCGSDHVAYLANARVWKCYERHARPKFSLKTGTIFEDSPLGLDKWLPALWLVVNCKNGVSSCETARDLGVTQK